MDKRSLLPRDKLKARGSLLPREKLEAKGISNLTDSDLITVILGSGVNGKDVVSVARSVSRMISSKIGEFGVQSVKSRREFANWEELATVHGVGKVKAMQVVCAFELGRRIFGVESMSRTILRNREDVLGEVKYLRTRKQEHVVMLMLNARNELIGKKTVAIGSLNKSVVEPRDIFGEAVRNNAAGIILVHNHPSGDTSPSTADVRFTEKIKKAGDLMGIELLDHIII